MTSEQPSQPKQPSRRVDYKVQKLMQDIELKMTLQAKPSEPITVRK